MKVILKTVLPVGFYLSCVEGILSPITIVVSVLVFITVSVSDTEATFHSCMTLNYRALS